VTNLIVRIPLTQTSSNFVTFFVKVELVEVGGLSVLVVAESAFNGKPKGPHILIRLTVRERESNTDDGERESNTDEPPRGDCAILLKPDGNQRCWRGEYRQCGGGD
jgi:hypothetical protein